MDVWHIEWLCCSDIDFNQKYVAKGTMRREVEGDREEEGERLEDNNSINSSNHWLIIYNYLSP